MATQPDPWAEFRAPAAPISAPASGSVPELVVSDPFRAAADARAEAAEARAAAAETRARTNFEQQQADRQQYGPQQRAPRQLPEKAIQRLDDGTSTLMALDRALGNFNPDFAGNTLTGGIENTIQSKISSFGTPGQRDWWADVRAMDNVSRNQLFGAALTATEKAAWESTTVNPGMDPAEVQRNLSRRQEIARAALRRLSRTYRANGFNEEAIRESLGELQRDILGLSPSPPGSESADDVRNAISAAAENLPETPTGRPEGAVLFNDEARPPVPEGFSPEQASAYDAFLTANPTATADQLRAFGRSIGFEINNADEIVEARDAGAGAQRGENARIRPPDISDVRGAGGLPETLDAIARGAADVPTVGLADELAAAGDTFISPNGQSYGENLWRQREIDRFDTENHFWARLGGQIGGGFAIPTNLGRATFGGARNALRAGATREGARLAATQAGARQLGIEGATFGGLYGAGSAEGDLGDRLAQGGVSALVGGGAGYGAGRGIGAIVNRRAGRDTGGGASDLLDAYNLRQAAERQGVDIMPADVGGPMTRRLTAGAAQSPISAGTIMRGAERTRTQAGNVLDELAQAEGAPQRQEVLGDTVINAANRFIDESGLAGRQLYSEARELSQDVMANAPRAFRNLNAQLRELRATEAVEGPLIAGLNRFRDVIADEGGLRALDIDAIRRLRTAVATEARTEGLRGTDYQRRAGQVLDDLREDITSQLSPEAAAAFRRADNAWRERLETIDSVMTRILGNDRSAEGVSRSLSNMATGDSARLNSFLRAIPAEDARIIRGSLIQNLGRATPGQQNAAGDAFSLETFLSNWNRMPSRTREMLFPGSSRQAIEDLALIAQGTRETGRYANRSNTGSVALGGAMGYGAALTPWVIPAMAANYVTGRMLASPVMVRWLAREPRNPAQARQQIRQLTRIAKTQPAISSEVLGLQQALLRQLGERTAPLAAQSGGDEQD